MSDYCYQSTSNSFIIKRKYQINAPKSRILICHSHTYNYSKMIKLVKNLGKSVNYECIKH